MSFFEIFLIAVSLCFDTLAVSIVGGACVKSMSLWNRWKIMLFMAMFQGGLAFAGWLLGSTVSGYVGKFDHWVAFGLLAFIGGKMIADSLRPDEGSEPVDLLKTGSLVVASVATSIDALAVGISFAMTGGFGCGKILWSTAVIATVTALASDMGLRGGRRLGDRLGHKCDIIGGIVLVLIGIKILIEHLLQ